ncbi:MAG: phosphatase PAP2 family protein [Candidatus Lokiarchaeota archaeon]
METSMREQIKKIENWDYKIFLELYKSEFSKSKKVVIFAKIYSFFGNFYFWGLIWLIMGIYGFFTKDYYLFVLFTGAFEQSIGLYLLIRYLIVRRNRPYITLKDKGVIQQDELVREHKSFPSGHVTFFLLFGCIFAFYFNSWFVFLLFLGLDFIMAGTRLILGVHFPTDVIFGFVFGLLFAYLYLCCTYPYWVGFFYWLGHTFSPF